MARADQLYELSALFLNVWERIDEELGDDGEIPHDLKLCLDAVEGDLKDNWEEYAKFVAEYERQAEACEAEIKRLKTRAAAATNKAERMKEYILGSMVAAGFKKHQGKLFTLTVQNNPPSVKIINEAAIPDQFCETRMTLHVSKSAIAAHIKKTLAEAEAKDEPISPDEIVPGALLVTTQQLRIK